jgi:asparagine synthase (glutamine-hydrolysing)
VEDKLSMANSLESRVPFLDIDLVNYIIAINPEEKFHKKNGKILLKDAIKKIVPNNVLNNPKVGFVPPVEYWNESENQKFISKLLDKEKISKYEIFNTNYVEDLKLQFFNQDYSIARKFWSILSIQAWLDIFFSDELNHESFYNFDYKNTYEREH